MTETFDLNQDNLLLQLKNMPKPPISKELAKELGFDQKKYESIIQKLLEQISEVRKERLKENYLFEQKIKSMNIPTQNKNKKIVIKNNFINNNNIKKNNKNLKINLNRPKSNYKTVRSSGYGMPQKKIDIFSTRIKKKINDNINKNKKLIPKGKIITNNNKGNNSIKEPIKNLEGNKKINKINNDLKNNINTPKFNLNKIKEDINKINNENKQIEEQYKISGIKYNNFQKNNKSNIINKNNNELVKKNIENISNNLINDLLYELIDDLNNIEKNKKENETKMNKKININQKKEKKNLIIIHKYILKPNEKLIKRCDIYRQKFYEHLKLKGSFFANDIFKIYDEFVEEISNNILEQSLDYCIEQMDNFIKKMENQK